jgi:hypothetical protein
MASATLALDVGLQLAGEGGRRMLRTEVVVGVDSSNIARLEERIGRLRGERRRSSSEANPIFQYLKLISRKEPSELLIKSDLSIVHHRIEQGN